MSRFVVARCCLWCRTGAFSGLFSLRRMPLKQDAAYRHSQSNKGFRKIYRRVIDERVLKEQLDMMKLSVADLESADSFGSLGVDCDVGEDLRRLAKADHPEPTLARRKSASTEVSVKTDEHSLTHSDRQVTADGRQEGAAKGSYRSRQASSKHSHENRITVPSGTSDQMNEHLEIYNKFSGEKSLSDLHPEAKDWSEKFGSLSKDVDKFLDKYVGDATRYSCHLTSCFSKSG